MSTRQMVINKKELAPGIVVYSDVIEDKILPKDIEEGMLSAKIKWDQAKVTDNNGIDVDTKIRDAMAIYVPYKDQTVPDFLTIKDAFYSSLSNAFLDSFSKLEKDYMEEYCFKTVSHDEYGILKYGLGQHVTNHIDDDQINHRRLSSVYYVNDDYEGGEIIFPRFNIMYKPQANELLLFPSTYVYNHTVLPVKNGTRYAVVSWMR